MNRLGMINANLGQLYSKGKQDPCNDWCLDTSRIYLKPTPRLTCQMPNDHEYTYGLPHIDFGNYKVWRNGILDDLWFKTKDQVGAETFDAVYMNRFPDEAYEKKPGRVKE